MIPVLLMRNRGLVKTMRFKDPKYVGDPLNAIRIFNEKQVDELMLLDIARGSTGMGPDFETVLDVASECFMPLAYGGGVTTVEHADRLFAMGVEKVVVRSGAANDLRLVEQIARFGGTQSVSVCVDVERSRLGKRRIYAPGTRMHKGTDWLGYVKDAANAGAGEIVLQSVDRDGTQTGLDLQLVTMAAEQIPVPLVAVGGIGGLDDMRAGVDAGASAIGVGSYFVFHGPRRAVLITYPDYTELEALFDSRHP